MQKTYTAEDRLAASKFAVISGKDLLPAQDSATNTARGDHQRLQSESRR